MAISSTEGHGMSERYSYDRRAAQAPIDPKIKAWVKHALEVLEPLRRDFPGLRLNKSVGPSGGAVMIGLGADITKSPYVDLSVTLRADGTGRLWSPPVQKGVHPQPTMEGDADDLLTKVVQWFHRNKNNLRAPSADDLALIIKDAIDGARDTERNQPHDRVLVKPDRIEITFRAYQDHSHGQDFHLIDDDDEREDISRAYYERVERTYVGIIERCLKQHGLDPSRYTIQVTHGDKDYYDAWIHLPRVK